MATLLLRYDSLLIDLYLSDSERDGVKSFDAVSGTPLLLQTTVIVSGTKVS